MKIKPILFNTDMVKAILKGSKTQTRRIVNFDKIAKQSGCTKGTLAYSDTFKSWAVFNGNNDVDLCLIDAPIEKGDVLWVRESFYKHYETPKDYKGIKPGANFYYTASVNEKKEWLQLWYKKMPSIFMPKKACRIFLEVTNVRVEKLRDISESDSKAEGVAFLRGETDKFGYKCYTDDYAIGYATAKDSFLSLWQSIHGAKSDLDNPFVWVYEFNKVDKPSSF